MTTPDTNPDAVAALAEKVDDAMRRHAEGHKASNSPHNFYCGPICVSEHLRYVIGRELQKAGWLAPSLVAAQVDAARAEALAPILALADRWDEWLPIYWKDGRRVLDDIDVTDLTAEIRAAAREAAR